MIEILGGRHHHDSRASLEDGRCFTLRPAKPKPDWERILVLGTSSSGALCVLLHADGCWADFLPSTSCGERGTLDLVLIPHANRSTINRIVGRAHELIDPSAEVVMIVPRSDHDFVNLAVDVLIKAGFDRPYVQPSRSHTRIYARKLPN